MSETLTWLFPEEIYYLWARGLNAGEYSMHPCCYPHIIIAWNFILPIFITAAFIAFERTKRAYELQDRLQQIFNFQVLAYDLRCGSYFYIPSPRTKAVEMW